MPSSSPLISGGVGGSESASGAGGGGYSALATDPTQATSAGSGDPLYNADAVKRIEDEETEKKLKLFMGITVTLVILIFIFTILAFAFSVACWVRLGNIREGGRWEKRDAAAITNYASYQRDDNDDDNGDGDGNRFTDREETCRLLIEGSGYTDIEGFPSVRCYLEVVDYVCKGSPRWRHGDKVDDPLNTTTTTTTTTAAK